MDDLTTLIMARAEVKRGWCQGNAVSPDGDVCIRGAVGVALGLLDRSTPRCLPAYSYLPVESKLAAALPEGRAGLALFNDSSTEEDVVALFDRAIATEAQSLAPNVDPAHSFLQGA